MKSLIVLLAVCGSVAAALAATDFSTVPGSADRAPAIVSSPLPKPHARAKDSRLRVLVWIREDGSVDTAQPVGGTREWAPSVVEAVRNWKFEPVMWEGKPIPARTEVVFSCFGGKRVSFSEHPLPNLPGETHLQDEPGVVAPELAYEPETLLPLMVSADRRKISASLDYVVDEEGRTVEIEPAAATTEGALRSALDIIAERSYKPATIRGTPVRVKYSQNIVFSTMQTPIEALADAEDIVDPAYPYERALAEESGSAVVRFTLDREGGIASTELVEASHADFGGALIAAVESWKFSPVAAESVREYRHEFRLDRLSYAGRRMMKEIKAGNRPSNAAAGLDARPEILGRPALGYPRAMMASGAAGTAQIEFVIDRTGLAQLPRVLKASDPAFGWAAVTCVNGMRFKPLTRSGKPAELRVVLPFTFQPPGS